MKRFVRRSVAALLPFIAIQAEGCGATQRGSHDAATRASESDVPDPSKCSLNVGQKLAPVTARRFGREDQRVTFPSGNVTVLGFLSTWNRFADKALPHLQRLQDQYGAQGLSVIDIDSEADVFGRALPEFWESHRVSFPVVWDADTAINTKLRASGVIVAVVDRAGVVRYIADGNTATDDIDDRALDRAVRHLLAAPASTIPSYAPPPCETTLGQKLAASTYPRLDALGTTIAIPSGKWTLLAFIATWNGPAKQALPDLQRISNDYAARGLTVIAVAVDDEKSGVVAFVRGGSASSLPIVWDEGRRISARLQPTSMPTFILLDAEGRVRYIARGYRGDLRAELERGTHTLL